MPKHPDFSEHCTLSFHKSLVRGGITGLIIGVRFQVGKSISGVFYGREREQQQGVVAFHVVYPPQALQARVSAAFSLR